MYTHLDLYNARLYATQHLLYYKYNKYKQTHPYLFNHVIVSKRKAISTQDYFVPPNLSQDQCIVYEFKFTQTGCQKVGCFPFKEGAEPCDTFDTRVVRFGDQFTFACQPACQNLYKTKGGNSIITMDTEYRAGECRQLNHFLKLVALKPRSRDPNVTLDVDFTKQKLLITETYCHAHGLAFFVDNNDCGTTTAQDIGEFFISSSAYRSLNLKTQPPVLKPLPIPQIPDDIKNNNNWLQPPPKVKAPDDLIKALQSDIEIEGEEDDAFSEFVTSVIKEYAIDKTIDMTAHKVSHILRKTIPKELLKKINPATAVTFIKFRSAMQITSMVVKGIGASIQIATVVLAVVGIVTIFVDLFDPGQFNIVLSKKEVDGISKKCQQAFQYQMTDSAIVNPEMILYLLDGDGLQDSETVQFVEDKVTEYLNALDVNSYGQRLDVEQAHLEYILKSLNVERYQYENKKNLYIIFHFFITTLCLLTSIAFLQFLPYIAVGYLLFITVFNNAINTQ